MWSGVLFREHQVGRLISLVDNSIISISIESQKNPTQQYTKIANLMTSPALKKITSLCAYLTPKIYPDTHTNPISSLCRY